ncbi:phosphate acetyltransferase [Planctomycetota bacterium]
MSVIDSYIDKIKGKALRVVFPEGRDERLIQAARKLKDDGLAEPVLLGSAEQIAQATAKAGVDIADIEVIAPKQSDKLESYAESYAARRDGINAKIAKRIISKPMFYGGMMVSTGDVDTMVAGAASATATVIQAGTLAVGLAEGINTVSSFFLMVIPDFLGEKDKRFIYADCAVNIDPTAEELADIALASAKSGAKLLGEEPRVAMISFSTKGSASGPKVSKVVKALEIARGHEPNLAIDGEFQADTAVVPAVAAKKVKTESAVAGKANVLIFPDLDTGNASYKLTQYMAGAKAIGPFLQGFAAPISDLSRGASVDDIVSTTIITLAQL